MVQSVIRKRRGAFLKAAALGTLACVAVAASGSTIQYGYDPLGRLNSVSYDNGSNFTYTYDPAGNRTQVQTSVDTTAPTAPSGLSGTAVSAHQVNLSWTASTDSQSGVASYRIYRSGTQIGTSSTINYSDTTVVGSTLYSYTVAAVDNANNVSGQSAAASVQTPDITPPSVPTGLSASAAAYNVVNLSWNASADDPGGTGVGGYYVYRGGALIGTTAATSYQDSTVTGSTTYTYTVAAYDRATPAANVSAQSSPGSVTTPPIPDTTPPSIPTGLTGSAVSASQINLSWNAAIDNDGCGVHGYTIFRGGVQIGTSGTTNFSDTGLSEVTTYTYTVNAYDCVPNVSGQSAPAGITTPAAIPTVPTGLTGPSGTIFTGSYTVSWQPSSVSGSTLSYYNLSETNTANSATTVYQINVPTTSMSFNKGANGSDFTYKVRACTVRSACSAYSPMIEVITCPRAGCR